MKVGDIIWETQNMEELANCWDDDDWVVRKVRIATITEGCITVQAIDSPDDFSHLSPDEVFLSRDAALAAMIRQSNASFLLAKNELDKEAYIARRISEECARGLRGK